MEILGGKKQNLVEVAKKLKNPTVEKFTGFLINSNCVYQEWSNSGVIRGRVQDSIFRNAYLHRKVIVTFQQLDRFY